MSESGYKLIFRGFDASVSETDDSMVYHVILSESGNKVYEHDVRINIEGEELLIEDIINYAAKATIDLFEAGRGTLGQGARSLGVKADKMKSAQSISMVQPTVCYFLQSSQYESWLNQLKGTPYEQQAILLLDQLIESNIPGATNTELDELYKNKDQITYDLDKLNLERMKTSKPNQQIIIIQAKTACDLDWVEGFLNAFKDNRLEAQAILKVKELIDITSAINLASAKNEDKWKQQDDIRHQMNELLALKTKSDVDARLPETGIEIAPEMAKDVAELMEGVSFAEPLQPMFASKRGQDDFEEDSEAFDLGFGDAEHGGSIEGNPYDSGTKEYDSWLAGFKESRRHERKLKAQEDKDPFYVEEFGDELGKKHEGLDPAEVPEEDRFDFQVNDKIKLKNEVVVPLRGGTTLIVEKGTKGWVTSLWDEHGDKCLVKLEDGSEFVVDFEDLSRDGKKTGANVRVDEDLIRKFKNEGRADGKGAATEEKAQKYYGYSSTGSGSLMDKGFEKLCLEYEITDEDIDSMGGSGIGGQDKLGMAYEEGFQDGWNYVVDDLTWESEKNPHMAKKAQGLPFSKKRKMDKDVDMGYVRKITSPRYKKQQEESENICEACGHPISEAEARYYQEEGGKGYPSTCSECAEAEIMP